MLRAAAASSLLDKNLGGLDRSATKGTRSVTRFGDESGRSFDKVEQNARRAERSSSLLVDSIAMLAPAVVPISAAAVPALVGLTSQLGFAVAGAGVAVLAFHGIGDALKSVSDYQLEPTAAHLAKMREEMAKLGPAGRDFVHELQQMRAQLQPLQDTAQAGLFPGLTAGIDALESRIPQVERIINQIATQSGTLFSQAGDALAGPAWDDFFSFLEREAAPTLQSLGETIGNVAATAANLWVAFEPMENSFSTGLVNATQKMQDWSAGLSKTQGFQEFIDYVRESGPQVAHTLAQLGNAFVQIIQAAAPMGGPTLKILGTFADLLARIANSPLGTPLFALAAGLAAVNRALTISAMAKDSLVSDLILGKRGAGGARGPNGIKQTGAALLGLRTNLRSVGKSAALVGGLTLATSDLHDKFALTNTASLALAGTIAGPWGTAIGAGVGAVLDLKAATDKGAESFAKYKASLPGLSTADLFDKKHALSSVPTPERGVGGTAAYTKGQNYQKTQRDLAAVNKELALRGAREGAASMALLKEGFVTTAAGGRVAAESIKEFNQRVLTMEGRLGRRGLQRDFQASLDDMRKSLKENGKTLDITTEKGRNNQAALDNIAASALNVAKNMKGVDRVKFLSGARKGFVDAAVAAGRTRAQAKALADRLIGIGLLKPKPKVSLDIAAARRAASSFDRQLAYLVRQRTAQIGVTLAGIGAASAALAGLTAPRTVHVKTVQGKAAGGWVAGPGGPRDDMVPTMLSNREYVVNANSARQYASELEWINAQGLRNGGYAGAAPINVSAPSMAGMRLTGSLDTPWGPAQVQVIAADAARSEIADHLDTTGANDRNHY